jgi:predicted helicase
MDIQEYLNNIKKSYKTHLATEHSYRGDLKTLIESMVSGILVTNEPKRQECGAPDYIIQKKDVPLGYIEAKDIGGDLDKVEKSEQMKRYKNSLENLILTNYLEFRFYRYGEKVETIALATIEKDKIKPNADSFDSFTNRIKDFCEFIGQTIKSPEILAKIMAHKAKMIEEAFFKAVTIDALNNSLKDQLTAFRKILIHDMDEKTFADVYAQTIAYGLFAARLHDTTLEDFSRQEARGLIPRSNPFLRSLFDYISGAELDDRVAWIIDDLCVAFRATDVRALLKDFGKMSGQADPFIHFYETFLAEYDPALRKSRGVYYTPEPVVDFIVRAVDDILKDEFGIADGLAHTGKVKIEVEDKVKIPHKNATKTPMKEIEVHRVQILDPATGTGTFLYKTVEHIHRRFEGQEGIWSDYVDEHLLPRIHGFEILMASYTMCHMKIELLLSETGYQPKDNQTQKRLRVFLTNSLEEPHPDTGILFASWLSREAQEANAVKHETPVMVVIGNPPYSGESQNKDKWIMNLMEDYKKEPEGKVKLDEKNSKWINDDYVKFIRFAQYFIEKNGEGILAFINNHGFLDNPTFRGMRWNLLSVFDKIYCLDLHGNSKKKEACPDGSKDENVFDIQQGVSINLFIKKKGRKNAGDLAEVYHADCYGARDAKYEWLHTHSVKDAGFALLSNTPPNYYFVPKDFDLQTIYNEGFAVNELFSVNSVGIVTARDEFVIDNYKSQLENRIKDFFNLSENEVVSKYNIKESSNWKIDIVKKKAKNYSADFLQKISYRPFDDRIVYYNTNFIERSRYDIMRHFLAGENVGLVIPRQAITDNYSHVQVTNYIVDNRIHYSNKGIPVVCPLYLYPDEDSLDKARKPNLNDAIVTEIATRLELSFTPEKTQGDSVFAPIDILDYIYAVLHCPSYREKYREFLKIDFPRVPYPTDADSFWQLVRLGGELRQIHLLESPVVSRFITRFPESGNNTVEKLSYENGKVFINETQYFEGVLQNVWEFYIGGYQPAQKWLKDRKGRMLSYDDITHYQKIIVALSETIRIMQEIEGVKEW